MEPLHPDARAALKRVHPALTDDEIDQYEDLLTRRMACDPEKEARQIEAIDKERTALMEKCMPRFCEVVQAVSAKAVAPAKPAKPKFKVKLKRRPSDG